MVHTNHKPTNSDPMEIYGRAMARIVSDLGLPPSKAHSAMAEFAAAYGVFLDDVAHAVLSARTIKRGLSRALKYVVFDRQRSVTSQAIQESK